MKVSGKESEDLSVNQGLLYEELTQRIINCFYKVYDVLGEGFLESVYEKALMIELEDAGIKAESQKSLSVNYKNRGLPILRQIFWLKTR